MLVKSNYTFNGNVPPTSNTQHQFTFNADADSAGRILLAGRRSPSNVGTAGSPDYGVFLNALRLAIVNPTPTPTDLGALMVNNNASAYLRHSFNLADPAASPPSACASRPTMASWPTSTA